MYVGISFIKATETMNIKAFGRKTHKKNAYLNMFVPLSAKSSYAVVKK